MCVCNPGFVSNGASCLGMLKYQSFFKYIFNLAIFINIFPEFRTNEWIDLGTSFNDEFFFSTTKGNFMAAESLCAAQGGFLYEPMDSRVLDAVFDYAQRGGHVGFWLGINDKAMENTFVYSSSNSPITLTNWDVGRPDNLGNDEDCVHVLTNEKWNDENCDTFQPYIVCESKYSEFFFISTEVKQS